MGRVVRVTGGSLPVLIVSKLFSAPLLGAAGKVLRENDGGALLLMAVVGVRPHPAPPNRRGWCLSPKASGGDRGWWAYMPINERAWMMGPFVGASICLARMWGRARRRRPGCRWDCVSGPGAGRGKSLLGDDGLPGGDRGHCAAAHVQDFPPGPLLIPLFAGISAIHALTFIHIYGLPP